MPERVLAAVVATQLAVGINAWLALAGHRIGERLPRRALLRVGGVMFATLALIAAADGW